MTVPLGIGVVLAAVLMARAAHAAPTAQEQLDKVLKKNTRDLSDPTAKDRAACVCLDGGVVDMRGGWLRRQVVSDAGGATNRFRVRCFVEGFDDEGNVNDVDACDDFAVIGR
jgi:hypothetical protein